MVEESIAQGPTAGKWLTLARIYAEQELEGRALHAFNEVIALDPGRTEVFEEAGLLYLSRGSHDLARKHLETAVARDPDLWRSHNGLGILADLRKDHAAAREHFSAAIDLNPEKPQLVNNLGYSAYLAGDLDEAELRFIEALQLDPQFEQAKMNLSLLLANQRRYSEALNFLKRNEKPWVAHNDVGYIALLNRDWLVADKLLREAVSLSPQYFEAAHQNLKRLARDREAGSVALLAGNTVKLADASVTSTHARTSCATNQFPGLCEECLTAANPATCMANINATIHKLMRR